MSKNSVSSNREGVNPPYKTLSEEEAFGVDPFLAEYDEANLNGLVERPTSTPTPPVAPKPQQEQPDEALAHFAADDAGNSEAVKYLYGDEILFTLERGWMVWNGRYWEVNEERVKLLVVDTLKRRRAAAVYTENERVVQATKADARRVQGCMMLLGAMALVKIDEFNANPDLLNVKNGVLNLRTGKLEPHHHSKRFTYCCPIEFNEKADYSRWEAFLRENVTGGDETVRFLQEAAGYSLTGHTSDECLFYLFGPPRAGKGTFVEVMRETLGSTLSQEAAFNSFTMKRDGNAQNFDLAPLNAARVVVASESNARERLNGASIKNITGGGAISCEFKYHDRFTYIPRFKIWLNTNHPVNGDPDDGALWNRIRIVEFPNSHEDDADPTIKAGFKARESLEGVLLWAVRGAQRWYERGKLEVPQVSVDMRKEQRDRVDSVGLWLEDCCTLDPHGFLFSTAVRESYQNWCRENGFEPKGATNFNESLRRRGLKPNTTKRSGTGVSKVVEGICLQ